MTIENLVIEEDVVETDAPKTSYIKPTGLYKAMVDMAYLGKSSGGATTLNMHFKLADGSVVRNVLYVTTTPDKGGKPYRTVNGKKYILPDMRMANQIAKITADTQLGAMSTETRTVKLYDFDAREERPTQVPALTEMIGKGILVGFVLKRENKSRPDGSGGWTKTSKVKETNVVSAVFYPDGYSTVERTAGAKEAKAVEKWKEDNPTNHVDDSWEPVKEPDPVDQDDLPGFDDEATTTDTDAATSAIFDD